MLHIDVNGKVSPCSWIAKLDSENEFSSFWPENSLKDCVKKFKNLENTKQLRKEKFGYCGCVALASIYKGDFLAEDPLNEFLRFCYWFDRLCYEVIVSRLFHNIGYY